MLNPQNISESSAAVRDNRGTSVNYKSAHGKGTGNSWDFSVRNLELDQGGQKLSVVNGYNSFIILMLRKAYYSEMPLLLSESLNQFSSWIRLKVICVKNTRGRSQQSVSSTRSFLYGENLIVMEKKHFRSFDNSCFISIIKAAKLSCYCEFFLLGSIPSRAFFWWRKQERTLKQLFFPLGESPSLLLSPMSSWDDRAAWCLYSLIKPTDNCQSVLL